MRHIYYLYIDEFAQKAERDILSLKKARSGGEISCIIESKKLISGNESFKALWSGIRRQSILIINTHSNSQYMGTANLDASHTNFTECLSVDELRTLPANGNIQGLIFLGCNAARSRRGGNIASVLSGLISSRGILIAAKGNVRSGTSEPSYHASEGFYQYKGGVSSIKSSYTVQQLVSMVGSALPVNLPPIILPGGRVKKASPRPPQRPSALPRLIH